MADTSSVGGWIGSSPELPAVLTLVAGLALALLLRKGVTALGEWANRFALRGGTRAAPAVTPVFLQALRFAVFWGVLAAAVVRSLAYFGEQGGLVDELWSFLTRLLVALAIVAAGHVLGVLARNLATGLLRKRDHNLAALPQVVYGLILGISLVMALAHLGLDVSLITAVALIAFAAFLAAIGLAFALGARGLVANLTARQEIERYRPGDRLRVDGIEGTVLEVDRMAIVLTTAEGLARIPAARFAETTVLILKADGEADG
jgi:small-conductance mechanosensitive channel